MTTADIRQKVVDTISGWLGAKKGDATHKEILSIYNSYEPLPRNYKLTVNDAWCAATASAAWISAGTASICPIECSCSRMIALAKTLGIWVENDAYIPQPGDAVIYDWQDGSNYATTDNQGDPDHVGIVKDVANGTITVIEGNKNGMVGTRVLAVNGRYIRGFVCPDYAKLADTCEITMPMLRKGDRSGYVKTLQILLNKYIRAGLSEDGYFGNQTEKKVKKYQQIVGYEQTGIMDGKTWIHLLK